MKKLLITITLMIFTLVSFSQLGEVISTDLSENNPDAAEIKKLMKSKYGYDARLSLEEHRKKLKDAGYTISYTIPDKTIYTYTGIGLVLIVIAFWYISNKKTFEKID